MQKYDFAIILNRVLEKHLRAEFNFVIIWSACFKKAHLKGCKDIVGHTFEAPLIISLLEVIWEKTRDLLVHLYIFLTQIYQVQVHGVETVGLIVL